jgi:hypothetical protein
VKQKIICFATRKSLKFQPELRSYCFIISRVFDDLGEETEGKSGKQNKRIRKKAFALFFHSRGIFNYLLIYERKKAKNKNEEIAKAEIEKKKNIS